ncbi:hypothetical protein [Natronomonas marina]|uniref:hypothetical protein n=1 Tax=Natronomonas marina TaxID=2961939 RepID=UPI0020C9957A|nr:hypothetical protein [Natronomonas marina]
MSTVAPALAAAGSGPDINYESSDASPAYIHEDTLTIAEYDRGEMALSADNIEYESDDGDVEQLPAHYNDSQDEPVQVRFDRVDEDSLHQFPRVSGESENAHTWLNASNWSTTSGAGSSMTVTDDDGDTASGVPAVSFDGSVASTETANATLSNGINISSDADKRFLTVFFAVDTLKSASNITIEVHDSDGDYKAMEIAPGASNSSTNIGATTTGEGYVYQERLSDLSFKGSSGDDTWDEIQSVRVSVQEANGEVTITGLDVARKSEIELGETMRDTDGDGENETETVTQINGTHYEGYVNLTALDTMGSEFDDAAVHELKINDVWYSESDLADEEDWNASFEAADNYSYDRKLDKQVRLVVPSAIDLSHGTLELRMHQGLVDDRYAEVRYATDTGDTEFGNVSDSDYTETSSSFTSRGDYVTLTTVNADENAIVDATILLQPSEEENLMSAGAGGGAPMGEGGGGIFSSIQGTIMAAVGALLGLLGLSRLSG